MSRTRRALLLLGVLTLGAVGCTAPASETTACGDPDRGVVREIAGRLEVPGTLRYAQTVEPGENDLQFVSAELHEPDDEDDEDGELHTWLVTDDGIAAVDERARDHSGWPDADVDVREDGAVESRACADAERTDQQDGDDDDGQCPSGAAAAACRRG